MTSAISVSPLPLVASLLVLGVVSTLVSVPLRYAVAGALGPLPMVLLYGATVNHVTALDVLVGVLKGALAATGLMVAVATTPGPQLLAPLVRYLPTWASIAVLVTYRAVFRLAERVMYSRRAVRLRGGLPPWSLNSTRLWRRIEVFGAIAGVTLLGAIDLGGRYGDALRLRGVPPRVRTERLDTSSVRLATRVVMGVAVLELVIGVAGRLVRS